MADHDHYDVIIIGSGAGGGTLAWKLAPSGKRILLLEGLPNLQELGKLLIGEAVKEVLECDLKGEMEGIAAYRKAIKVCEDAHDYVSRDLFLKILADEENHADHLQTQLDLIEQMGIQNYVQLNSESPAEIKEGD